MFDPTNGAHFVYADLLRRLADLSRNPNSRPAREPLKEKTISINNATEAKQMSKAPRPSQVDHKPLLRVRSNDKDNQSKTQQIKMAPNLSKLMLANQENNFIEQKLQE